MLPQTFVDETGRPIPIKIQRDGAGNPVLPFTVASGVVNAGTLNGVYKATPVTRTDGQKSDLVTDAQENWKVTLATNIAGEDIANDVTKVEQRFGSTRCTADTLVKTGVGFLHSIVVSQPSSSTPTAGVLTVYDNTAESGTVLFQHYFPASAVTSPVTITLNSSFSVGCYVGYDATLAGLAFNIIAR